MTLSVRKVFQLGIGAVVLAAGHMAQAQPYTQDQPGAWHEAADPQPEVDQPDGHGQIAQAQPHTQVKPRGWHEVVDPQPEFNQSDSHDQITSDVLGTAKALTIASPSSSSPPAVGQLEILQGSQPSPEIVSIGATRESTPPRWELVEPEVATPSVVSSQLAWELLPPGEEFTEARLARELEENRATQAEAEALAESALRPEQPRRWIMGLGGGARIGIGDPTFPMVFGRVGRRLSEELAISLRPNYIFGNSDNQGNRNNEGAFQMPLTLDFAPDELFSPFFGLGIATNTDSNGKTEPMVSAGVDLNITPNLSIAASINVIYQSGDQDSRDVEALTVLYLRF